jgi:DNA-binding LacI/PurR family transcriptional regulator/signal transduction histidine kinase
MNPYPDRPFMKNIGVITAELSDSYQAEIWRGIVAKTIELEVGLVCFLGSRINSPLPTEHNANIVYSLAGKDQIDGLIVISSAISTYVGVEQVAQLLETWEGIPRVSIGLEIPGISSITVEGDDGIDKVIRHVIHTHGRRSFALITGPENHPESRVRCKQFMKTLQEEGISADSVARYQGDFQLESGRQGIISLLESGARFDALFCLNDNMAMGAMEELERQGYQIPEDISLIGFDGIEEPQFFNPSLTTIRQPLHELGEAAVEMISYQLLGTSTENRVLQCRPLIGESCGCKAIQSGFYPKNSDYGSKEYDYPDQTIERITQLIRSEKEEELFDALIEALGSSIHSPSGLQSLLSILYAIQDELIHESTQDAQTNLEGVISVVAKAVAFLNKQLIFSLSARRLREFEQNVQTRSFGANISEAFDKETILETLREGLHFLGFSQGYFGFLTHWNEGSSNDLGPWELYHISDQVRYLNQFTGGFQELPNALRDPWGNSRWVIKPLVSESQTFGILMLPVKVNDPGFYDIISKQIASTLKGYHLMEQVKRHERDLEKIVHKRTQDLIRINSKLQAEVESRIRLEQEVIDISNHTMNRIGQDLHDDLCQHLAGIAMITKVLGNTLPPGSDEAQSVHRIVTMLGDSIERAKNISRGLVTIGLAKNDFIDTLESLIESLRKTSGKTITLFIDRGFEIPAGDRRVQIYRIIQEALNNAIKHSGCQTISVTLGLTNKQELKDHRESNKIHPSTSHPSLLFYVKIEDDGKGFRKKDPTKGMGLHIMEYRAEKARVSLEFQRSQTGGTTVICRALS